MPELLKAILLGIVEGLTEFIPVSSTGHLILVGDLLKFQDDFAKVFEIFIQLGAILAVVWLYFERFRELFRFQGESRGFAGWSGLVKLGVACVPACIVGFYFHGFIKEKLFNSTSVAYALIVGGVLLVLLDRGDRKPRVLSLDEVSLKQSLGIGIAQCLSLWPGISRSGSTIIGGLLLGLDRRVAAEFSFLVAVPIMGVATTYDLLKNMKFLGGSGITLLVFGFVTSFIVGALSIKIFVKLLNRFTLKPFGYYRIALGGIALILMLTQPAH